MKKSARQRKDSRRKERIRRAKAQLSSAPGGPSLTHAATWPVYECLISEAWQTRFALSQVIVSRRAPDGNIAAAIFLIDLACLGIKDAFGRIYPGQNDYRYEVRRLNNATPLKPCSIHLAAKVVHAAAEYAARWGFSPHPDSREPMKLLVGAEPALAPEEVPLGDEQGEPFFVSGPHDNSERIVAKLRATAGEGHFNYVVLLPGAESLGSDVTWVSPPGSFGDEDDGDDV